jgi:hypothetical protein
MAPCNAGMLSEYRFLASWPEGLSENPSACAWHVRGQGRRVGQPMLVEAVGSSSTTLHCTACAAGAIASAGTTSIASRGEPEARISALTP